MDLSYAVHRFYYFAITNLYNAQFSLTLNDPTHLEANFIALLHHDNLLEGSYSIHRYVWWTLMAKLGLGILDAQVVSLLGARNLASMRGKGKLNMLDDP